MFKYKELKRKKKKKKKRKKIEKINNNLKFREKKDKSKKKNLPIPNLNKETHLKAVTEQASIDPDLDLERVRKIKKENIQKRTDILQVSKEDKADHNKEDPDHPKKEN